MTEDNGVSQARRNAEAWYAELQKKGEKRLLIEATERGDEQSHEQATRLVERYPDVALQAILVGVKAAHDSWSRDLLVATVGEIKGDGPLPFLLQEVSEGPYSSGRLFAAESLHKRGRPEGVAAMIAEWESRQPKRPAHQDQGTKDGERPEAGLPSVAEFLAGCGKIEAIKALAKDLCQRPVALRMTVIFSFGESLAGGDAWHRPGERHNADDAKGVREAIVDLLVASLDDTEERTGMSGTWYGWSYSDPRICDVAGQMLNHLDSKMYAFDVSASLARRDSNLIELKNVWRLDHGLMPLPLPVPRTISEVPETKLGPLVDRLLSAPPARRTDVEREIEKLGLGALPGVQRRLQKPGDKTDPQRAILEHLARRIACIIDKAEIGQDSPKPDSTLRAKLAAMKGRSFDPALFFELVQLSDQNLPAGVHGLRICVDRAGDGTGVAVKVYLLDQHQVKGVFQVGSFKRDPKLPKGEPSSWNFDERVEVGGKGVHGAMGACLHSYLMEGIRSDLRTALETACLAGPGDQIKVRLQLIPDSAR
jgi:hypothetical protein